MLLAVASRSCSTAIKQAELGLSTHTMSSEHRIRVEYFDATTKMDWAGVPRPMVEYTGDGINDRAFDVPGVEMSRRHELRLAAPRWSNAADDRSISVVEAIDKAAVCRFQNKWPSFVRRATRCSIKKTENFLQEGDGLVQAREPSMKSQTGGSCRLDSAHALLLQTQQAGAVGAVCDGCEVDGGCSGTVECNRCRSETDEGCPQARWQFNLLRIKQRQRHRLLMQELRSTVSWLDDISAGGSMVGGDWKDDDVVVDNDVATTGSVTVAALARAATVHTDY